MSDFVLYVLMMTEKSLAKLIGTEYTDGRVFDTAAAANWTETISCVSPVIAHRRIAFEKLFVPIAQHE